MSDTTPQPSEQTVSNQAAMDQPVTRLNDKPHAVKAGRGLNWLTDSWALLKKEPLVFAVMGLVSLVAIFILNLIPFLGSLAVTLLWPAMMAGFFLAFKHAKQQQTVSLNDLFTPFRAPGSLIGVGGMYLLASIVLVVVLGIVAFFSLGSVSALSNGQADFSQMGSGLIILGLLSIPAALALAMAFVFAPVLVHEHQVPVIEAIKRSFAGSLRNILPFIVFFIVLTLCMIIIGLLSAIPLLGWLLGIAVAIMYLPLSCGALFFAYSDIFLSQSDSEL